MFTEKSIILNDNKLTIRVDSHAKFGSIKGFGSKEGSTVDYDFKVQENLMPILEVPVGTEDKLTVASPWLDNNVVLPLYIANLFKTEQELANAFKTGGVFITNGNDAFKCLLDMISLTIGFASDFEGVPRYTQQDANNDPSINASDVGKIKDNIFITSRKFNIRGLVGKTAIDAITGIYTTYLDNHSDITDPANKILKEMITALSRYINSHESISKGKNSFNKAYLPWTLEPSSLIFGSQGDFYGIPTNTKAIVKSEYFKTSSSGIELTKNQDISELKTIDAGRIMTMPEIGESIQAIDSIAHPGDIDSTTNNSLKNIVYSPIITQTAFEHIYLNSADKSISAGTKQLTMEIDKGNVNILTDAEILDKAHRITGIPQSQIKILNKGTETKTPIKSATLSKGNETPQLPGHFLTLLNVMDKNSPFYIPNRILKFYNNSWYWIPKNELYLLNPNYQGRKEEAYKLEDQNGNMVISNWLWNYQLDILGKAYSEKRFFMVALKQKWDTLHGSFSSKLSQIIPTRAANGYHASLEYNNLDGRIELLNTFPALKGRDAIYEFVQTDSNTGTIQAFNYTWENIKVGYDVQAITFNFENRDSVFDKNKWIQFLYNMGIMNNDRVELTLERKYTQIDIDKITKIIFSGYWNDLYEIKVGNEWISIPSFNKDDETIGKQTIIIF